jgi:F-type H+-transporting ATPase subunit b
MELELRHVLTQIIAFILMYLILKKYVWNRLYGVIDERRKRIEHEFSTIENDKLEAKKLHEMYEQKLSDLDTEAHAKFSAAIAEGKKAAEEIQRATQKESQSMLEKARADIEREVGKAKTQLKNEVVNLVIAASKKVIQADLDAEKQKKMILDFVDKADLK